MPFFTGYLAQGTGPASAFVENATTGYARAAMSTTELANGSCTLATPTFIQSQAPATLTQRALFDAPTGGNMIMWWNLTTPIVATSTSVERVRVGAMSHTFPALNGGLGSGAQPVDFLAGSRIGTTSEGLPIVAGHFIEVVNGTVAAKGTV